MRVKFTFSKIDQTHVSLTYRAFNYEHSKLWLKSIVNFLDSEQQLTDCERVYNFNDYNSELLSTLDNCNLTIQKINQFYSMNIPLIRLDYLQDDINFVHTFFVDSDRNNINDTLWTKLNEFLHGLEIIQRSKNKKMQGQVFCSLPNSVKYDIPNDSYKFFTITKKFGYCYANYPHVGRHILEMYNAKDQEAHDDHVLPMNKIAGDFYLWFGSNTNWLYDLKTMFNIKRWFKQNRIGQTVSMNWGDPKLSIGWLPVAIIDQPLSKKDLIGLCRIIKIEIVE